MAAESKKIVVLIWAHEGTLEEIRERIRALQDEYEEAEITIFQEEP